MIEPRSAFVAKGCALLLTSGLLAAWMTPPTRQHAVIGSPLEPYRHHDPDPGANGVEAASPFDQPSFAALSYPPAPLDTRDIYDDGGPGLGEIAYRSIEPHRRHVAADASETSEDSAGDRIGENAPQTPPETQETMASDARPVAGGRYDPPQPAEAASAPTMIDESR